MGFFDKIFGGGQPSQPQNTGYGQPQGFGAPQGFAPTQGGQTGALSGQPRALSADEQAVARYRYMLQSAPPDQIEQAHQEAFARLTPEQRQLALQQLATVTPQNEQNALSDDPRSLARAATRAEMRQPGTLERAFGGQQMGGHPGMMGGGMMGGMGGGLLGGGMMTGLLTGLAGGFVGSAIANSFFNNPVNAQGFEQSMGGLGADGGTGDFNAYDNAAPDMSNAQGADPYGDPATSADPYGDPADAGGFDGGGDFGGGDFGGDF